MTTPRRKSIDERDFSLAIQKWCAKKKGRKEAISLNPWCASNFQISKISKGAKKK